MSEHTQHSIARYIDAEISAASCTFGSVCQEGPLIQGDCNVLRLHLLDEPPESALIYVRFINALTFDSYGDISRELTDGMEITVPNDDGLFDSTGSMYIAFTIEANGCKESSPRSQKINTVKKRGNEYVGETGVVLIEDVYAAGEAAEAAAENANTAAAELRQAAINGDFDGQDGAPGQPGADGFSPVASVSKAGKVATISITDKTGTTTATVSDGQDGSPGAPGSDGFSPEASVEQTAYGAAITITDADGTTTANIYNGQNGAAAGFGTPTATVDGNTGTPSVEIAASGENTAKIFSFAFHNLKGENGRDGNKTYICTNFSTTETYAVGDYVMYSSALYECTTAHTGAWNASNFTAVTLNEGDLICNTDENSSVAWSDITGKPTIPTAVSQLTNDSGYQTAAQVTAAINSALGVIENGSY